MNEPRKTEPRHPAEYAFTDSYARARREQARAVNNALDALVKRVKKLWVH